MAENTQDIFFEGFEKVNIRKILLILNETYNQDISCFKQLKKLLNSRLNDRFEYNYQGIPENNFIAFYSDFYFRKDHLLIFNNFMKAFPDIDCVTPIKLHKERRNWKRGFEMIKWDIHSLWILKNIKIEFKRKIYWIRILGLARYYCKKMEEYLKKKQYIYGLVYSDSNPYENMLVQLMKLKGIHTATLQHGIFDKNGYWKGIEFRASVADDWLAWNLYTKDLAIECGVSKNRIKILGIPRYINPIKIEKKNDTGVFSVVLGEKVLDEENKKLIKIANLLAKKEKLNYFLRYHPTCKGNEYNAIINSQFVIQVPDQQEGIIQMCEGSDFCLLVSGTSIFIDLIYLGQPFFQYCEECKKMQYKWRENFFESYEELVKQIEKEKNLRNDKMFEYYCTTTDVKSAYNKYFNSI